MKRAFDVIVVGAGVAGTACAREFAESGVQTAVVDPRPAGSGTTGAAMGHIVVMDDSPSQLALCLYGRELWLKMKESLPESVEYETPGTIWIASEPEDMALVQSKHLRCSGASIRSAILDTAALAEAEPNLREGLAGGLLVPDDAVVYPPAAAQANLEAAKRAGAEVIVGEMMSAGGGSLTLTDGRTLASDHIVIATGAEMRFFPWARISRRKGHLIITDRYPGFLRHQLVELGYMKSAHSVVADSVAFNVQPRRTGQILIGSSRQYRQNDTVADTKVVQLQLRRAMEYMPKLGSLSASRVWTGFRAATPDNLPLIGPTHDPTLYLLTGFEGLGITMAPAAARLLADHMLARPPAIDPKPYLPERMTRTATHHA